MNIKPLLFVLFAAVFSSCSSIYKAGQTPDDVYYSPAKEYTEFDERDRYRNEYTYHDYTEDRYLRMRVSNFSRWRWIDDFDYWYDSRYDFTVFNNPCNTVVNPKTGMVFTDCYNYWGNAYRWNSFRYPWYFRGGWYNPVTPILFYKNSYTYRGTTSGSNLQAFTNRNYSNRNWNTGSIKNGNSNNYSGFGNLFRQVFSNSGSYGSNPSSSWSTPIRTFGSNTQTSSSAGGNSGGYDSKGSSSNSGRPPRKN